MTHCTTPRFWRLHDQLPEAIQTLAKKKYELLKSDPHHPSLHFKKVDTEHWPARIGRRYRELATMADGNYLWFWIGSHAEYDRILASR